MAKTKRRPAEKGDSPKRSPESVATVASGDEPRAVAREAGLRYISDDRPGISRRRAGRGFTYTGPDGQRVTDRATLDRIRSLAIPPAWNEVWICPDPRGHLQAVGRDTRGRKQYRYHPRWREVRDQNKFGRMVAFGKTLPRIRRRVDRDLRRKGLPREKILAAVVRLLETTLIRVGNDEYARQNDSFGLTTLRQDHVEAGETAIRFHFRGKGGIEHEVTLSDRRLARVIKRCQELEGQELFAYLGDDGERHTVNSADVNEYLRQITGQDFTAKDFRTWAGTVLAAQALRAMGSFDSEANAKRNVVEAIEAVASRLGNTREICRKCYVHPTVVDAYLNGSLVTVARQRAEDQLTRDLTVLPAEEAAVLALLKRDLDRQSTKVA